MFWKYCLQIILVKKVINLANVVEGLLHLDHVYESNIEDTWNDSVANVLLFTDSRDTIG